MNIDSKNAPASSFELQGSLALVRSFSGRTFDEVWRDIKHGQNMRIFYQEMEESQDQKKEPTLGETTLENFLIEVGLFVSNASLGLDRVLSTPQTFTQHIGLSSSPSIEALSDAPERGQKRYIHGDAIEKTLDRRLKRKIKNRESVARSRARKQAYRNELVSKVSRLEEENMKLKKEKDLDKMLTCESSPKAKYQLRRTSSFLYVALTEICLVPQALGLSLEVYWEEVCWDFISKCLVLLFVAVMLWPTHLPFVILASMYIL